MGWAALSNGRLLRAATGERFDAFVTVDQNVEFQQNLAALPISVAIMVSENNRLETLKAFAPGVLSWLAQPLRLEIVRIDADGGITVVSPS